MKMKLNESPKKNKSENQKSAAGYVCGCVTELFRIFALSVQYKTFTDSKSYKKLHP